MPDPTYRLSFATALTKAYLGTPDKWSPKHQAEAAITLQCVLNEVTGLQVVIEAAHEFVLVVDQANWLHPLGFTQRLRLETIFPTLPLEVVEVFPIGFLEGDDRRLWTEVLDRSGYAEVPPQRPQAVYVRIRIPSGLEPGTHEGKLRAFAQFGFGDEAQVWEGKVRLEVAAVALPDVRDYSFHLNLWQHLTALSRQHHVPLWSEAHFVIIERYYASLAQIGQKAVSIVASEFPWSGQSCYRDRGYPSYLFEHNQIATRRTADGRLRLDFSVVDRVLSLAAKYGIDREINLIGLINIWVDEEFGFGKVAQDAPDAVRVRCYDETAGIYTYLRTADELREYIRAVYDHFSQLGLLDRVRVTADEPGDLARFNRSLAFIKEVAPGFQYGAAINHFEFLEETPPEVLDFTPVLPLACQDPDLTRRLTQSLHERGGRMFWYVCCWPPIPNTFLHSPLVEARLHGWLNHALHLDGFLRWAFCLWPADPWERASFRAPSWPAGDMFFVLPGRDGAPVETLRYEALRAAVQDYELICLAERVLPAEKFAAVYQEALGCILRTETLNDFARVAEMKAEDLYSLDPQDYLRARQALVEALGKA